MRCCIVRVPGYELMFAEMPEVDQVQFFQELVEGSFEVVSLPKVDIDMWMNQEGKYDRSLLPNEWATGAAFHGGAGLAPWDFVMGNVVLTGTADSQGETTGLTHVQMDWLRKVTY